MRDLGWATGFLEGEGSFAFNRTEAIQAFQVNEEPLIRLKEIFGGSIRGQNRSARENRKDISYWFVTGARASGVVMTLFPMFSGRRQEQIKRALSAQKES